MNDKLGARTGRHALLLSAGLWLVAVAFYATEPLLFEPLSWRRGVFLASCAALGLSLCWIVYIVMRMVSARSLLVRTCTAGGLTAGAVLIHGAADTWLGIVLIYRGVPDPGVRVDPLAALLALNITALAPVYALFAVMVALMLSTETLQRRERSLADARAAAQEAQLSSLRFQINPHFLFNVLNAVTSLVSAHRHEEAEAMLMNLADFFRAALSKDPAAMVSLEDEIDVIGSYLQIEAVRFGDRLQVDFDIPDALSQAPVPQLLLQPLVENAIKYAVAPSCRPVSIHVTADTDGSCLVLKVADDGDATSAVSGAGVGLSNVAARLSALFGDRAGLRTTRLEPGFVAEVRMPLSPTRITRQAA